MTSPSNRLLHSFRALCSRKRCVTRFIFFLKLKPPPPFKLCESLEQSDQQVRLKDELAGPLRIMQETARRISRVSNESKLTVDEEEYVNKFRSELMDVVYQWCNVLFSFLFLSFLSFHWLILFSESHPFFLLLFFVVFRVSNSQM